MLAGKKILLGVTGSIAAYKAAYLTRLLVKAGAQVKVVMTPAAKEFISPLTLTTLSRNPVISEFSTSSTGEWNSHVDLALWADLILVAPATANTIAKMANGLCDNLLTAIYLSARTNVLIAPAMDLDMFKHPSTIENLKMIKARKGEVIPPDKGELASGLTGEGRMAEPEAIISFISDFLKKKLPLYGKKALVTAGPTHEAIDPVRFIGNSSSGKMGFAIAEELAAKGAEVTLVTGPSSLTLKNNRIQRIDVVSADQMLKSCLKFSPVANLIVMAAAVADYRPEKKVYRKIKKEEGGMDSISLVPTTDILAALGKIKKKQFLVGFALETEQGLINARKKMKNKNLDMIVLNTVSEKTGFTHDTNRITIIKRNGVRELPLMSKQECAREIVLEILNKVIK